MSDTAHPSHQWASRGSIRTFSNGRLWCITYSSDGNALIDLGEAPRPLILRGEWPKGKSITLFEHEGDRLVTRSRVEHLKGPKVLGFLPGSVTEVHRFELPDGLGELRVIHRFAERSYFVNDERIDLERKRCPWGQWYQFKDFDLYVPMRTSANPPSTFSMRDPGKYLVAVVCSYIEHTAYQHLTSI